MPLPSLPDLDGRSSRHDVAWGKVLGSRGVSLHVSLSLGVEENGPLPAASFCDQAAGSINTCKDKFN